jgi:hypothetical protein
MKGHENIPMRLADAWAGKRAGGGGCDGIVNLLPVDRVTAHEGARLLGPSVLSDGGKARDFVPGVESFS